VKDASRVSPRFIRPVSKAAFASGSQNADRGFKSASGLAPPMKRLYYYGMWEQNSNGAQNFDTGLLKSGTGPGGGDPRMAYSVYSSHTHDHPRG
jgi:hypothetical protein